MPACSHSCLGTFWETASDNKANGWHRDGSKHCTERGWCSSDQALEGKENDLHCLLKRSSCYSYLGNIGKALEDSDSALSAYPDHYKALLQKAEVLYNKGDFEFALVYFHRGRKKRPERHEFR
ncbi:hypothetical protein AHF37_01393, partial [Paragonimus kellicotti]